MLEQKLRHLGLAGCRGKMERVVRLAAIAWTSAPMVSRTSASCSLPERIAACRAVMPARSFASSSDPREMRSSEGALPRIERCHMQWRASERIAGINLGPGVKQLLTSARSPWIAAIARETGGRRVGHGSTGGRRRLTRFGTAATADERESRRKHQGSPPRAMSGRRAHADSRRPSPPRAAVVREAAILRTSRAETPTGRQPLLRKPAAILLMVRWSPRATRSSVSPAQVPLEQFHLEMVQRIHVRETLLDGTSEKVVGQNPPALRWPTGACG